MLALHEFYHEKPDVSITIDEVLKRAELQGNADVEWNIQYLFYSGYIAGVNIKLHGFTQFYDLKITELGRNLVEDKALFNRTFPAMQVNISIEGVISQIKKAIEESDLPPVEKKDLLDAYRKVVSHPIVSTVIATNMLEFIQRYGDRIFCAEED